MTESKIALEYCEGLYQALAENLCLLNHVNDITGYLKSISLSPTFPEVRFCKGCVLPIEDEFTTQFLINKFLANKSDIQMALLCEGFQTLDQYYPKTDRMSGYSRSPWNRDKILDSKSGLAIKSGANPDFCIRYNHENKLRAVGEVKYLPKRKRSDAGIRQVFKELRHYMAIPSSSHSDWGHDFGFGIMYCGNSSSASKVELIRDAWETERIVIAYFHD